MELKQMLEKMVKDGASDLHLKAGLSPILRIDGSLHSLKENPLSPEELRQIAFQLMPKEMQDTFARNKELDFAIGVSGLGRFRVNAYMQRGSIALALRAIPISILHIDELNLPSIVKDLAVAQRGLILVTGTTGSGKSTTLAAMIEQINENISKNIITVEDPIEFLFRDKKSIISQRELGTDTDSFAAALKHVMRQDPDVILIGEIRDKSTIATAVQAADTGHLVMSTLHTLNATETINRIISFYPPHQHEHIRVLLSSTLVAAVSLRLLPRADGKGRVPAVEILIATPTVREYLLDPMKTLLIPELIEDGLQYGMQTFDQSIMKHYKEGRVTYDVAIQNVTNPDEFKLRLRGIQGAAEAKTWEHFEGKKSQ
ncbi:MAG: type IV pilus twitching motility protein PilT [Candidatus Edwardsbacteria bacterium]